ncbi:hypothetical protein LQ948_02055 [Jiella sp. MQZ9-1]|uniref:Uncharacterized protein n=1 Tax=Jiella flava TaxID=2816857 RepID=A0A939FW55_9HYPH|nr:hypothetical protein [Jiella flava]MBO0661346.1 hypothetical protein [Jiella flava]MCD2469991.1 hypothetical protein [Jiella flava]
MSTVIALNDQQAEELAQSILQERLRDFGFRGVAIASERDFDGDAVLRMTVDVDHQVPGRVMLDIGGAIRGALLERGDERFALLTYRRPEGLAAPGLSQPAEPGHD